MKTWQVILIAVASFLAGGLTLLFIIAGGY